MTDLLLAYDFPPIGGGIARWMAEIAERYPGGPSSLVVSTGTMPNADDRGLAVDRIGVPAGRLRTLPGLWRWGRRVRALVASRDIEFVWCGNVRPAGYLGWWLDRVAGMPYGIILHGGDLLRLRDRFRRSAVKRAVARRLLGRARWLVANSGWTASLASEVLGELGVLESGRVRVVGLGSDPGRFRPGADTVAVRSRYRIAADRRRILTVARLVPHKGIDIAIAALGQLAARHPDLEYLVAGEGPDRGRLERLAVAAGVAERVRWLGSVPTEDLPGLYALADLYLGLSREEGLEAEGFGIALADAAAAGVAVIAGRSGGTADAVRDGETGLRVDPTDAGAVASAVSGLLEHPAGMHALGVAGREWVVRELNWDRSVRALAELSRSAAKSARP